MEHDAPTSASPILVTGAHRSGTTWVGKMLAATPQVAYISEPLNVLHRPGVYGAPISYWYTYITEENESSYLPAFQKTLVYRYDVLAELRSLRSGRDMLRMMRDFYTFTVGRLQKRRPLLKDPFAVFSIEWFAKRLNCRVVITVRHPAAFASSLKRLGWSFNLQKNLFTQPLLVRDHLEIYRQALEAEPPKDLIERAAWLWRIIYRTVWKITQQHPEFHIVRQEDLALDAITGFRRLYRALDLKFTPRAEQIILSSSSAENPVEPTRTHSIRLNSRASLQNWKKRLTQEEIARIRILTADTWPLYYTEDEW